MKIIPTEQILGAQVQGLDLSRTLTDTEFDTLVLALGNHGVRVSESNADDCTAQSL